MCTVPSPKAAFQSCPFWRQVTHSIATTSSDFFALLSSPSSIRPSGYGRYWLLTDLTSAHYANNILVLLQQQSICFVPKDADSPCCLAPPGGRFLGCAQKGCLDGGWEVTPILALKQKNKQKAGEFPFQQFFASSIWSMSNWQFALKRVVRQSTVRH